MIKYGDIICESLVDGEGIRVTAFLQGCPRHCLDCHNESLISTCGGIEIDEKQFAELLISKLTPLHRGITFSGGDPLMQHEALNSVIKILKDIKPNLNIWVYTGYLYEEIASLPVLKYIDVLVDGPFIKSQKRLDLPFRGSLNQRIIDVQKSLNTNTVCLYEVPHTWHFDAQNNL